MEKAADFKNTNANFVQTLEKQIKISCYPGHCIPETKSVTSIYDEKLQNHHEVQEPLL